MLRHDEPKRTQEVGQDQDEEQEAEDLEALDDEDLSHDERPVNFLLRSNVRISLDLLDQASAEPLTHVACESLQVHQNEDLAEPEEPQQEDEAGRVRVVLVLDDPVQGPGKARDHIEKEAAADVVLGDLEDVPDLSAGVPRVKVVGEEVPHQVRDEAYLHYCFKNDNTLHRGLAETGEERCENGREEREDDDEDQEDGDGFRGGIDDELLKDCRLLRVHICLLDLLLRFAFEGHAEADVIVAS